jgi:hypothetical protein
VVSMLRAARISYRESSGNFLTPATIWVEPYEFSRASAVVQRCIAEYGASHAASRQRPTKLFAGGYKPWQVWRFSTITVILALAMLLGTFAVYPVLVAFGVLR